MRFQTKNKMIVVSHPQGNRNVRAIISALDQANMLAEYDTTIAVNSADFWVNLLPAKIKKEFLRREFPLSKNQIHTCGCREIMRMTALKLGVASLTRHEKGWASVDSVYRDMDRMVAERLPVILKKHDLKAVYAYEDGALSTFTRAKELGLTCIYDLPIAYWETGRTLMMDEAERKPAWAGTLGGGIKDSEKKVDRKRRELEMADIVVCPGVFVMDSLPVWAKSKKLIISPFGSPAAAGTNNNQDAGAGDFFNRPLRILFVGSMGQRKGLGDLFEAMKILAGKDVELVVMGSLLDSMDFYRSEFKNFRYEPGRSHNQVLELMRSCDVFCLPSIVEGRALVMQEAMSQQLPIIITPNTGGADLIIEGQTGFLVPVKSPEKIAEKINWFLDNKGQIPLMGKMAQEHASKYTWEQYGHQVVNSIIDYLEQKNV